MRAATGRGCRIIHDIEIPMRDGVKLHTSVYLPPEEGSYPTVLVRSAYNRLFSFDVSFPTNGMALVVLDCRGRYDSEGEFYPFIHEAEDGYDTIEWVGRQPWCDGNIGMFGNSYLAGTQFALAQTGSKYLKALNPCFMSGDYWKQAYYSNGAFSLGLTWSWLCLEVASRVSHAANMPLMNVMDILRTLPLIELDQVSGAGCVPSYRDYVTRSRYDVVWERLSLRNRYHHFDMPVLLIGGWYDYYPSETAANFLGMREHAPSPKIRDSHRMIIGPWMHGMSSSTTLGELDFGEDSLTQNDATLRWLECILKGKEASEFQAAPVSIFVMGLNRWRDENEWPLARTHYVNYYLRGDGELTRRTPQTADAPDRYVYDPADPVPTTGGNHSIGPYNPGLYEHAMPGPFDQRAVEARPDVLVYTSDVLERDTEVTGPVTVRLFASSSALDTDFVARLTDVYPDGRSINITEGVLRARFREDVWGEPKLLEPGNVYEFAIELQITSNVFVAGHRIRVDITSSNFPLWDRNLNTGDDPGTGTEWLSAEQTIYHDASRPSHIVLPIIET